jgi:hypothetical protein
MLCAWPFERGKDRCSIFLKALADVITASAFKMRDSTGE